MYDELIKTLNNEPVISKNDHPAINSLKELCNYAKENPGSVIIADKPICIDKDCEKCVIGTRIKQTEKMISDYDKISALLESGELPSYCDI